MVFNHFYTCNFNGQYFIIFIF